MSARLTAYKALIACRKDKAWSDAVLSQLISRDGLDRRDAALATRLFFGVLQNRILLDHYIDGFLTGKKHLQPGLRDILRLGACQILFLDRIPAAVAVSESVALARGRYSSRECALVNAVLRRLAEHAATLELPKDYSVRYSHPPELVDLMKESLGKSLGTVLAADNEIPPITVVTNTLKTDAETLAGVFESETLDFTPHPWLKGAFNLKNTGDITARVSFRDGLFQVQDAAARLSVDLLRPLPGERLLDLCAAPGGKSLAAAMHMENRGEIISCDLHPGKLGEIRDAAARLGVDIISTKENDARQLREEWVGAFDRVIADVPCSGLGVIRKKPDIRYKNIADMEALPALQAEILETAASYVRPGGMLLYSTCTILKRENSAVVDAFLGRHPEYEPVSLTLPEGLTEEKCGMLSLYQGIHSCDGFFIACMRRRK